MPLAYQAKAESLRGLVCEVHPSSRWEVGVWLALGVASLVLLVLSFQL